jgi:hypothetical protein
MSNTRPTETHNEAKPTSDWQQPVPPLPPQHPTAVLSKSSVKRLADAATKRPIHAFTNSLAHAEVISLLGGKTSAA